MKRNRLKRAIGGALRPLLRPFRTDQEKAQAHFEDQLRKVEDEKEGSRNETLNSAAYVAGCLEAQGLDQATAEARLLEAALQTGLQHGEAIRTIRAAMRDGRAKGDAPAPSREFAAAFETVPLKIVETEISDRRAAAVAIWNSSVPISGTVAETYLRSRRIAGELPPSLRFGAGIRMIDGLPYPCVVAAITTPATGELLAIQRIALAADGSGKASIEVKKATLGRSRGGAVVLGSIDDRTPLVLEGEGVETVLSAVQATGIPGIATLSKSTLGRPALPAACAVTLLVERGAGAAGEAAAELRAKEGRDVRLARIPANLCQGKAGADANDVLCEHGTEAVGAMVAAAEPFVRSEEPVELPAAFRRRSDGSIQYCHSAADGEECWLDLCSPLEVIARTHNHQDGNGWGKLVRLRNPAGLWTQVNLPSKLFAGSGEAWRALLRDRGLELAPGRFARQKLEDLISNSQPTTEVLYVTSLGWRDKAFVLPDEVFGASAAKRIVFLSEQSLDHSFRTQGTLEGWKREIAARAFGNSRLMMAISAACAAPLLTPLKLEGGGFHICGHTSAGKTTLLQVAGSFFGGGDGPNGYLRGWRATTSGMEGAGVLHNDLLLCLDELAEADPDAAFDAAYMLANGQGKGRSDRTFGAIAPQKWKLLFLSTGEITLGDKIRERGRTITGGQEVRVVDIEADAGRGQGVFEQLHGALNPAQLADQLKDAASSHYGHAARAFLREITENRDHACAYARRIMDEFVAREGSDELSGRQRRVLKRFAVLAAGGELAVHYDILPWEPGTASQAIGRCWREWHEARRDAADRQTRAMVATVRKFVQVHGSSRFAPLSDPSRTVHDRAGFVEVTRDGGRIYYFFPDVWQGEVCGGFDPQAVANVLMGNGVLLAENGKPYVRKRLPGQTRRRYYVVTAAIDEI